MSVHATAEQAFAAVATPERWEDVGPAQIALQRIWVARGSYGCEHHLFVQHMRRVSITERLLASC